ncbi:MAG TPA: hypothetical protein VE175_16205, partial [Woeseiaceae bacterium]|nr:hypothetical protein [Woeseiaceae bacterium]
MRKVVLVCGACLALSGCGSFGWSGIADPFDGQGAYSTAAGPESGGDGAVGMALAEARTQPAGAQVAMSGGQQVRQPQVADGAQGEQAMPEAAAVKSALETGSAQFAKGHYGLALQSFRA